MISIEHHNSTSSASVNIKLHEICTLKGFYKKILNLFISYANNYSEIFPSRETIAFQVGCDTHHVDRVISRLESLGAIKKINRGYPYTNKYTIPDIFYLAEIREQLVKFYSSFKTWGMNSLMRAAALFKKNASLLDGILFNYIKLPVYRREYSALDDIDFLTEQRKIQEEEILDCDLQVDNPLISTISQEKSKITFTDTIYGESGAGLNSNLYFPDYEKIEEDRQRKEAHHQEYLKQIALEKEKKRIEEERFRKSPRLTKEQAYELLKKNDWI